MFVSNTKARSMCVLLRALMSRPDAMGLGLVEGFCRHCCSIAGSPRAEWGRRKVLGQRRFTRFIRLRIVISVLRMHPK